MKKFSDSEGAGIWSRNGSRVKSGGSGSDARLKI